MAVDIATWTHLQPTLDPSAPLGVPTWRGPGPSTSYLPHIEMLPKNPDEALKTQPKKQFTGIPTSTWRMLSL